MSALEAAAKQVRAEVEGCTDGSDRDDGFEQTMSDALVRVAEDSLGAAGGSAEPYRAVVHVDVESLVESSGERCELDHAPRSRPRRRGASAATHGSIRFSPKTAMS